MMTLPNQFKNQDTISLKIIFKKISIFIISLSISFLVFYFSFPLSYIHGEEKASVRLIPSSQIDTIASSAIVMDYNTGKIYWEKNADVLMYPASTTKIITAIIAIENIKDLNKKIKISKNASGRNHSNIIFKKGDEITLIDLLKAALIASTNNAAVALAEYVSGDVKDFVKLMNEKAKEIGALNTKFENTNGLDSNFPFHKTTARDLAEITAYCLKNDLFRQIVSTKKAVIHINNKEINIDNTNNLLDYDYIKGVKTGYTENAGFCLVAYSKKNGTELITVILNSSIYGKNYDSLRLINWVYNNFSKNKIVDSKSCAGSAVVKNNYTASNFDLYPEKDLEMLVNNSEDRIFYNYIIQDDISFPVKEGKSYGKLIVYVNNNKIDEMSLISKDNIDAPPVIAKAEQKSANEYDANRIEKFLIFLLSFYFLIFTIIIIKNLVKPESNY
ncbi:MAG: D-alanyl-D-alanine carboxypeptidase [Cyanobacteria bacterium]|nr:D-alanyl-D-alanine carboxypeptidase [Cyanobacteriota bacterium]